MGVDLLMDHAEATKIVINTGWRGFLKEFEHLYIDRAFFACSQEWLNNNQYICKFTGVYGDLIIGWYGVHGEKPDEAEKTTDAFNTNDAFLMAFAYGAVAFHKGIICVPAYDREFMDGMMGQKFQAGRNIPLMRAWAEGWSCARVNI